MTRHATHVTYWTHTWMRHVTYGWVTSRVQYYYFTAAWCSRYESHISIHISMSHVIYEWVTSHYQNFKWFSKSRYAPFFECGGMKNQKPASANDFTPSFIFKESSGTHLCVTWFINMWHDLFICVTWFINMWHDSFVFKESSGTHLLFVLFLFAGSSMHLGFTHSYVWHVAHDELDPFMYTCDMTHQYVTRLIYMRDMIHQYVTRLIHMCDM